MSPGMLGIVRRSSGISRGRHTVTIYRLFGSLQETQQLRRVSRNPPGASRVSKRCKESLGLLQDFLGMLRGSRDLPLHLHSRYPTSFSRSVQYQELPRELSNDLHKFPAPPVTPGELSKMHLL
jgi:hypothetical protein